MTELRQQKTAHPGGLRSSLLQVTRLGRWLYFTSKLYKTEKDKLVDAGTPLPADSALGPSTKKDKATKAALPTPQWMKHVSHVLVETTAELAKIALSNAIWMWLKASASRFLDEDLGGEDADPLDSINAPHRLALTFNYYLDSYQVNMHDVGLYFLTAL